MAALETSGSQIIPINVDAQSRREHVEFNKEVRLEESNIISQQVTQLVEQSFSFRDKHLGKQPVDEAEVESIDFHHNAKPPIMSHMLPLGALWSPNRVLLPIVSPPQVHLGEDVLIAHDRYYT